MSNNSTLTQTFEPQVRIVVSSVQAFVTIISLATNLLMLFVFIKGRHEFKKMSAFIIIFQMLLNDLLFIVVNIVIVIPMSYTNQQIYPYFIYYPIAFLNTVAFVCLLAFAFILTLNRLFLFIFPDINYVLFETKYKYWIFFLTWVIGIGFSLLIQLTGCDKIFNPENMSLYYACDSNPGLVRQILGFYSVYVPLGILALYLVIVIFIIYKKFSHKFGQHWKQEIYLLIQFMPQLKSLFNLNTTGVFCINLFTGFALFTSDSIVLLIFNSMIRKNVRELVFGKSESATLFQTTTTIKSIRSAQNGSNKVGPK